ncbi:MAG: hypothetical protein K2X38_14990 [Gemmataceae bacterium]|nr:hypothetical protein [Gemmataceae bacterium]
MDEWFVRGTALVAVFFFALGWPWRSPRPVDDSWGRVYWLMGWATCLVHVFVAFHLAHQWSHDRAVEATAKQTADLVGFPFGGGVWINYAFLAIWGMDAAWRWRFPSRYWMRSAGWHWTILGFLAFIMFNATVVFGGWRGRIVGVAGVATLVIVLVRKGSIRSDRGS